MFCVRTVVPNVTNFFFDTALATWSYGNKNGDAVLSLPFIVETYEYYYTSTTVKFRDILLKCV